MDKLKNSKAFRQMTGSFSRKIILITITGLMLGFFLSVIVSNSGLNRLKNDSIDEFKLRLESHTQDTYADYLEEVIRSMNIRMDSVNQEINILRDTTQRLFDHPYDLNAVNSVLAQSKNYSTAMTYNGAFQQNKSNPNSVVLAQGYSLNPDGSMKPGTLKALQQSQFLDLYLPSFYKYGLKKQQVYFTGNKDSNLYRVAPWSDLGGNLDKIYPEHNTTPNWDAFYPGLLSQWEHSIQHADTSLIQEDTPIYMQPSQDGATGNVIVSIKTGLWNADRTKILGTLSYDVKVDEIIAMIENMKISSNAFAFLTQSNGNIFAVNKAGRQVLGLSEAADLLNQSNQDAFKRMTLNLKNSKYRAIQNIDLPKGIETRIQRILLDNQPYLLLMKPLAASTMWSPDRQFYSDSWIAGFVIPEKDYIEPYSMVVESINKSSKDIILKQIMITLVLFAFISTIIFLIYDRLSINMTILLQATEQLRRKNYNINVEIDSDDEFGKLAQAYNDMTSEIKLTVQQLTMQNEILKLEIQEKMKMDEQIAYMKQYDALTGLPNKQSIYIKLDEMIQRSLIESKMGAFVVIGIDDFKKINEGYGIETGDALLKQVAERLRTSSGADFISRISGDEFGIVFTHLTVLDDLIPKLEHLRTLLNKRYNVHNKEVFITSSFGISSFPIDSTQSLDIVKFASATLIHSKETTKDNYKFYDVAIEANIKNKTEMMNELRHALDRHELSVVYQPIIDSRTQELIGIEALSRWRNGKFGQIPPALFIPIAEEIQFITHIEKWVIETALKDLKAIRKAGLDQCYISVNLSAIDLDSEHFMSYVEQQVSRGDLLSGDIQLEITESVLINNYDELTPKLSHLAKLGVKIALDDFGTGYSSLKYIKKLPIHTIKIDRSFVKDYPKFDDGSIAKIIINLAENLGLKVIAEGVETEGQAGFLSENQCFFHQGYLYDKPIPLDEIISKYALK